MSNTDKCGCLRALTSTDSPNVNAGCIAVTDAQCPKIRSTKRQVGPQCWRIKVADAKPKEAAPATAPVAPSQ